MVDSLTEITRYAELLMQATLVVCFFRWGLKRYRWFVSFIFAEAIRSCALFGLDNHSPLYAQVWSFTEPILWIMEFGAVLELMLLVYQNRPTAGRFARRLFVYYFPSALLVSVIVSLVEASPTALTVWWLLMAVTITKWLSWILLFMLVAQEMLYLAESQPIEQDLVLHRRLLVLYVGVIPGIDTVLALFRNRHIGDIANLCSEVAWTFCLIFWIVYFRRFGVRRRTRLAEQLG